MAQVAVMHAHVLFANGVLYCAVLLSDMARPVVLHVHVRQDSHPEGACPEPGRAGEPVQERPGAGRAIFPLVLRHHAAVRRM